VSGQRGQASVELGACALLLALAAVAVLELLAVARARVEAERLADQASVLAAEGIPLPDELRSRARFQRDGRRLRVSVALPVQLPGLPAEATVTTELPR
jgi:hypothetical protein